MESEVYGLLSEKDRELLGTLFETESAKAMLHAGDLYQQRKALHISMIADSFDNVLLNRGNIQGARFMYDLMKFAHSKINKEKQG